MPHSDAAVTATSPVRWALLSVQESNSEYEFCAGVRDTGQCTYDAQAHSHLSDAFIAVAHTLSGFIIFSQAEAGNISQIYVSDFQTPQTK